MIEALDKDMALYEQVYSILRDRIIHLEYIPGSFLTEASVANEMGISRMPVRVAMRKLENEGWLIADFRKKIKVREITARDVKEIYQLRKLLEVTGLKAIFDNDWTWEYSFRIEEIVVRVRAAQYDPYKWELHDTEFHMEIIKALDNERIEQIYRNNQDERIRIGLFSEKPPTHVQSVIKGMYEFVEAMRNKNYEASYEILNKEHLEDGLALALEKITKV